MRSSRWRSHACAGRTAWQARRRRRRQQRAAAAAGSAAQQQRSSSSARPTSTSPSSRHASLVAACAWWLGSLLLVQGGGVCPPDGAAAAPPPFCASLPRVCVDHSVFVLYSSRHNPRHELYDGGLPAPAARANVSLELFGFSDAWPGAAFQHPGPALRPATGGEESRDLAHPQFTRCSVPLVLLSHRAYTFGEFFINTVAALHVAQRSGALDRRLNLVLDTYGMRLARFQPFLLAPFTAFNVTTLSHLSSRLPLHTPESYCPDGHHVRCFRQLLLCQMGGGGAPAAAALAARGPLPSPLWSTGRAIFEHYKRELPPIDPSFADASKLRVLIAALPRRNNLRAMVNQEQVWSWCRNFKPPQGVTNWGGTACLLHEFGIDLRADLAYASQADVLLGLHSEALFWAFFMRRHSSVVEVRPHGWSGRLPDSRMKDVTAADGDSILWWGISIVNPLHSAPGVLEDQRRGLPHMWPRERHVFVRLMACQYVMERVALSRNSPETYAAFRGRGEHFITDELAPAEPGGGSSSGGGGGAGAGSGGSSSGGGAGAGSGGSSSDSAGGGGASDGSAGGGGGAGSTAARDATSGGAGQPAGQALVAALQANVAQQPEAAATAAGGTTQRRRRLLHVTAAAGAAAAA